MVDKLLIQSSKSLIGNHLNGLRCKYLDLYSSTYEMVIVLADFNVDIEEKHMKCFCDTGA